jgi:hypothetical protein
MTKMTGEAIVAAIKGTVGRYDRGLARSSDCEFYSARLRFECF